MVLFENVSKIYNGDIVALDDVSFKVNTGEFCFIVGSSGAGKSTIVRLLIRQERPTNGYIKFEEVDVPTIPRNLISLYRQQLGIVFQDLKLIPTKTIRENVEFALEIVDKSKNEIKETAQYLLEAVNLKDKGDLFPDQLSGGEKQRVAIARALANDPKLLIADEPTGNLDPKTSAEILEILKSINSWGTTVIVVTHDRDIVNMTKTRVLQMDNGSLIDDRAQGYSEKKEQENKKATDVVDLATNNKGSEKKKKKRAKRGKKK